MSQAVCHVIGVVVKDKKNHVIALMVLSFVGLMIVGGIMTNGMVPIVTLGIGVAAAVYAGLYFLIDYIREEML